MEMEMAQGKDLNHEPHAVVAGTQTPQPGDIVIDLLHGITPEPIVGTGAPSPLEEPDSPIPEIALIAMKDRRHTQWFKTLTGELGDDLELIVGKGADAIYVISDRKHHAMISRIVGASASCGYALVGRITMDHLQELVDETLRTKDAFSVAEHIELVGVAVLPGIATANIIEVATYEHAEAIPAEYRVGHAAQHFAKDLDITAY